ncbi:MAG: hypothetical protein ABL962_12390 [Fimbriimonadaceae bacterium]
MTGTLLIALSVLSPFQANVVKERQVNWVEKPVALDKLERQYGFKDITNQLLVKKAWRAKILAAVTWVPGFQEVRGRRAVIFRGFDETNRVVFALVAVRCMKGDDDENPALLIEHGGYFNLPMYTVNPDYREFSGYRWPNPFHNRPGRWAVLIEVRRGTVWATSDFVKAAFGAYNEKSPL